MIDTCHVSIDGTFCAPFIFITVGGALRGSPPEGDILAPTHYLHFAKVEKVVVSGIWINNTDFLCLNSVGLVDE